MLPWKCQVERKNSLTDAASTPLPCESGKENFAKRLTIIFLNTISDFLRLGKKNPPFFFGQSRYTFHKTSAVEKLDWEESRQRCKKKKGMEILEKYYPNKGNG